MRALNLPLPARIRCSDSARQLSRAIGARAAVVNMSYGASEPCYAEFEQVQRATSRGIALVAAAGNEFEIGNDPQFPASLPHVLTVAALDPDLGSSFFSNANAAVDVAAPGEGIVTAVPVAEDPDDTPDGYAALDGTSFSAPMAAAALAWIRAARPALTPDQAAQVLRLSARDIDRRGYDPNTGFGLVQVGAALRRRAPIADPGEPNEDVRWVRGTPFSAGKTIYRGGRSARTRALLDLYEDPRDVYRIVVPARGSLRVTLKPAFGDADLTVHDAAATTVGSRLRRLGASTRDGRRTDTVVVRNRRSSARSAWVAVTVDDDARELDSSYTLTVTRR
jgi:subtilisin family serine protease